MVQIKCVRSTPDVMGPTVKKKKYEKQTNKKTHNSLGPASIGVEVIDIMDEPL